MNKLRELLNEKGLHQISNRFDKKTVIKVFKGALLAGLGTSSLYLLSALDQVEFSNIHVAGAVAFAAPFLANVIKEYLKGE